MTPEQRLAAFREAAAELEAIDRAVYAEYHQDPLAPIIGEGNPDAEIAFFGRDPGREEVRRQLPFIGSGGQKVRGVLYRHFHNAEMPDFEASVTVGRRFFWANTLPYKPIGNKAWSMKAKKRFQPLVADLLLNAWQGREMITLGREAFLWFGIARDRAERNRLETFWAQPDRFETSLDWTLEGTDGQTRDIRLHPLPHPSPLNATWYKRFPALLAARLAVLSPVQGV